MWLLPCMLIDIIPLIIPTRDNSLELLQPMTANPIMFEFSRVLQYIISKGIRLTVLDST